MLSLPVSDFLPFPLPVKFCCKTWVSAISLVRPMLKYQGVAHLHRVSAHDCSCSATLQSSDVLTTSKWIAHRSISTRYRLQRHVLFSKESSHAPL